MVRCNGSRILLDSETFCIELFFCLIEGKTFQIRHFDSVCLGFGCLSVCFVGRSSEFKISEEAYQNKNDQCDNDDTGSNPHNCDCLIHFRIHLFEIIIIICLFVILVILFEAVTLFKFVSVILIM